MTKKILYLWACDYSENSGEGNLARIFVKYLEDKKKFTLRVNINKKFSNYRYLSPFMGILFCWRCFLRNRQVSYINYLPLWNFFIFILLPPKTILGPVTGGANYLNSNKFNYFIRKFIFPIFYKISEFFLYLRSEKIYFSTNLLKKYLSKKTTSKSIFNFIIKNIDFKKPVKKNKNIDFIIYYRKHINKETFFPYEFIKKLAFFGYKILVIGNKLNIKKIKNCGFLDNNSIKKLQSRSRFTIASEENIYSIFTIECLSNDVKILIDKKYNKQLNFLKKKFIITNFDKMSNFSKFKKKIYN